LGVETKGRVESGGKGKRWMPLGGILIGSDAKRKKIGLKGSQPQRNQGPPKSKRTVEDVFD